MTVVQAMSNASLRVMLGLPLVDALHRNSNHSTGAAVSNYGEQLHGISTSDLFMHRAAASIFVENSA